MTKSLKECENNPDTLDLELEKIWQKIGNISEDCIDDNKMIMQILNQMPSIHENKVDYVKHLIDSGTKPTLVDVVGHLRENICL